MWAAAVLLILYAEVSLPIKNMFPHSLCPSLTLTDPFSGCFGLVLYAEVSPQPTCSLAPSSLTFSLTYSTTTF